MSQYYKQEFVSPEPMFAEVKEELSSYFASGAIDDIMFPRWTEDCLKRFRKGAFKIEQIVLEVKNYQACLPSDFKGVREVWACRRFISDLYQSATAQYYQQDCRIEQIGSPNPFPDNLNPTGNCGPCDNMTGCTTNYNVVHKVTGTYYFSFTRTVMLTPGNINARNHCGEECPNVFASTQYSFDVNNGYLMTNFCDGTVHLLYYSDPAIDGNQMMPDNWWLKDFIRKYIIFKCFSKLSNLITDETFNQVMHKKQEAKQEQEEAFIVAQTEMKKQTTYEKLRAVRKSYESFNKYKLPGDSSYGHDRNI